MSYIIQRQTRFYVVAYDGLDPLTGKERRLWHPAGHDLAEAQSIAKRLDLEHDDPPPRSKARSPSAHSSPRRGCHVNAERSEPPRPTGTPGMSIATSSKRSATSRCVGSDSTILETFYSQLATTGGQLGHGLAPKTVLEVHMIVRAALDLAVRRELVGRNVAADEHLRLPRAGNAARTWTGYELARFLDAARSHRLYPALHLAAHTGMRRGEIAGLKWCDLDTSTQRLAIRRTLQCVGGQPVEFGCKTRTSRRSVELDHGTVDLLRGWRRRLIRDRLPHSADDWMFSNTAGRYLNPPINQPTLRPHRRPHQPAPRPVPRPPTHPRLTTHRVGRRHQSGQRTPRPRPPRLHHPHLPTPAPRHEHRGRRPVRDHDRRRKPVDVYRPGSREHPGQRTAQPTPGRRRR